MRHEREFFGERQLVLVYAARRLKEALAVERVLDGGGLDYAVVPTPFTSGVLFFSRRIGAFFYVVPQSEAQARQLLLAAGYKPYDGD